jgi:hypothetical protein
LRPCRALVSIIAAVALRAGWSGRAFRSRRADRPAIAVRALVTLRTLRPRRSLRTDGDRLSFGVEALQLRPHFGGGIRRAVGGEEGVVGHFGKEGGGVSEDESPLERRPEPDVPGEGRLHRVGAGAGHGHSHRAIVRTRVRASCRSIRTLTNR